jgi:uncharacterized protein involved in exopolysaccharide biosynthesis
MESDNPKTTVPSPSRDYYDDEIDLRDLILVVWRYRKLIVGLLLASLLIGAVISFAITPMYQVQAKISIGNYAVDSDSGEAQMTPGTAREMLLSRDFFQEEAWGEGTNAGELSVTPVENTNILDITLDTSDPQQGEALLKELINLFDERTREQYERSIELIDDNLKLTEIELKEIEQNIEQTRELLENTEASSVSEVQQAGLLDTLSRFLQQRDKLLEKKLQSEQKLNSIEGMQVLERPEASTAPVSPNKKLNVVLAGVLGLMVGVFGAFTVDYFRRNPLKLNND